MRLDGGLNSCAKNVQPGKFYDALDIERSCVSPCTGGNIGCLSLTSCITGNYLRIITDATY